MNQTINYFILTLVFLTLTINVVAQTVTSSPSATTTPSAKTQLDKDIQNLKDKLVDKVAEIQKKEQKAIAGIITKTEKDSVIIKTNDDQELIVKVDSTLTKIYKINGANTVNLKLGDLTKNDYIIVTGPLIDKTINANFIYQDDQYFVKSGKITEINKDEYYLKVTTTDKDNLILDIETLTKISLLNIKTIEIERFGFSKLKEGDTIHFVFKKTGSEKEINRYSAQKIFIIPQEYFMK